MRGRDKLAKRRNLPRLVSPFTQNNFWFLILHSYVNSSHTRVWQIFQSMTPSKRALARQTESPSSLKKRKQLTMDDYTSTVCILAKYALYSFLINLEVSCCVFTEADQCYCGRGRGENKLTYALNCLGFKSLWFWCGPDITILPTKVHATKAPSRFVLAPNISSDGWFENIMQKSDVESL